MSIQLTVLSLDFESSSAPESRVFQKNEVTFGRHSENDLVLDKPEVSSRHAKLRAARDADGIITLYITDLGSSNGTLVENTSLQPEVEVPMRANERIIIGNFLIKPVVLELTEEPEEEEEEDPTLEGSFAAEATPVEGGMAAAGGLEEVAFSAVGEADLAAAASPEEHGEHTNGLNGSASSYEAAREARAAEDFDLSDLFSADESRSSDEEPSEDEPSNEEPSAPETIEAGAPEAGAPATGGVTSPQSGSSERAQEASAVALVDGSDVLELNFIATELFRIEGTILHKGKGLAGVTIDGGELGSRTTGADGSFCFEDVADDTQFTLTASKSGYLLESAADGSARSAGTVHAADQRISFVARQLFTIGGKITHKGLPLEGVRIDGGTLGTTRTDENGEYRFADVPEGESYTVVPSLEKFIFSR